MDKCVLMKPDFSFEYEIKAYRTEMLDANSSMDGTGPLKQLENIKDWLKYCSEEIVMDTLELEEVKAILDQFSEKYITTTKKNTRIYEQYLILNETVNFAEPLKSRMLVSFDLFSPENLPEQNKGNTDLPEYCAINLFMLQVYAMSLGLQLLIR